MQSDSFIGMGVAAWALLLLSTIPAWITHVVYSIQNEKWILLLAGAVAAPIGAIHGWMIWFGAGL